MKQKPTQKSLKTVSILEFVNVKNPKKNVTSADTIDVDDVSTISGPLTSQSTLETNADLESSLQDLVTERENAVVYRSVGGSPSTAEFNSDSDPNLNSTRASDSNDLITQDFFENGRTFHEAGNSAVSLKPRNVIFTDTPKKSKWQDEKYSRRQRNCRRLE